MPDLQKYFDIMNKCSIKSFESAGAAMGQVKEVAGICAGVVMAATAFVGLVVAWLGLESAVGWQYALGGVGLCILVRVGAAVPVGLYFFARNVWGWDFDQSVVFALLGLLLVLPSVAAAIITSTTEAWSR